MFRNARKLAAFFVGSLALFGISSSSFAYEVLSNCNSGAAVVDYKYVSMGMRGGDYHYYQFVIRNQGVIDYLARTGAIAHRSIINNGHEALFHFDILDIPTPYMKVFSKGGLLHTEISEEWGDDKYIYELIKEGNGILFKAFSPYNEQASWFFEDCSATSVSEHISQ